MIRTALFSAILIAGVSAPSAQVAAPPVVAAQLTAADAAPFIGEWILALQGQNGPQQFNLVIRLEKEKIVGELTAETLPAQTITDVTKGGKGLVMRYSFDYQGTAVDAALSLTPAPEGKMAAEIDFAGGAYVMSGSATKKEPAK